MESSGILLSCSLAPSSSLGSTLVVCWVLFVCLFLGLLGFFCGGGFFWGEDRGFCVCVFLLIFFNLKKKGKPNWMGN